MSTKFKDFYDNVEEVEELMEAADRAATSPGNRDFIDNLYESFERYGMNAYLSYKQHEWFEQLANT